MKREKLEVGCFWCDMTNKEDPPAYWMNVVGLDASTKFYPVTSVKLSLELFQLFHNDGKALRRVLTRISKLEYIPEVLAYEKIDGSNA